MTKPTFKDIVSKLKQVLDGQIGREEVANWAESASHLFENESSLSENDVTVWKGLDVVMGIDIKDSPTEYLHNETDIRNWIARFTAILDSYKTKSE